MPRVSAASLRRLDVIEQMIDDDEVRAGGVMKVPAIMGLDEWEAVAGPMQQELVRSSHEDLERRVAEEPRFVHPMPAPVVTGQRTHTPDPHRKQEAVPMPPLPPRPPMGLTR